MPLYLHRKLLSWVERRCNLFAVITDSLCMLVCDRAYTTKCFMLEHGAACENMREWRYARVKICESEDMREWRYARVKICESEDMQALKLVVHVHMCRFFGATTHRGICMTMWKCLRNICHLFISGHTPSIGFHNQQRQPERTVKIMIRSVMHTEEIYCLRCASIMWETLLLWASLQCLHFKY